MKLSEDTKAIVASNLTHAFAVRESQLDMKRAIRITEYIDAEVDRIIEIYKKIRSRLDQEP